MIPGRWEFAVARNQGAHVFARGRSRPVHVGMPRRDAADEAKRGRAMMQALLCEGYPRRRAGWIAAIWWHCWEEMNR